MYDIDKRVELNESSVREVIASLMKLPLDMKVRFNGCGSGFIHVDTESNCCSFDDDELSEEYEERLTK